MTCKYCSQPLNETDKFCIKCGAEVSTPPENKNTSKSAIYRIASIIIMAIMVLLSFLPWLVVSGKSYSILLWTEYWNSTGLGLWFFTVQFLVIWTYSALAMPSIILTIVKKHNPPVVLPVATSLLSIVAVVFFCIMTLTSGIRITVSPVLLILLAMANIVLVYYNKRKK